MSAKTWFCTCGKERPSPTRCNECQSRLNGECPSCDFGLPFACVCLDEGELAEIEAVRRGEREWRYR